MNTLLLHCKATSSQNQEMTTHENHLSLVSIIRGVHEDLRKQYQACKDQESVGEMWEEHCKKEGILQQYASAMYQLADHHWKQNNSSTRIDWCHNVTREYFFNGGIQKELQKDLKLKTLVDNNINADDYKFQPMSKLRLLDVGSCYNPFKDYEEFISVALDICPATSDVHKCDFLNLEVIPQRTEAELTNCLTKLSSPIHFLPERSFHVVIFSLLLEYLPSAHQRMSCCVKAQHLLIKHGLLLIVTPDSKHQNHNAKMMKSWKLALESIGFKRIKYEKQTHLHCLAFQKVSNGLPDLLQSCQDLSETAQQLFIPQDFHDYLNSSNSLETTPVIRTDTDLEELKCGFMQLPQSC